MQHITVTENISLAYRLGQSQGASAPNNEMLYGFSPGHEVRGQNLRVNLKFLKPSTANVLELKDQVKKNLKSWDHSHVNDLEPFKNQAVVTLERICQEMWKGLNNDDLISVELEQGNWKVEANRSLKPEELLLKYRSRFQSLLKNDTQFIPLDLELHLGWQGQVDPELGIFWPWHFLKKQILAAQKNLEVADKKLFELTDKDQFLKKVAGLISGTPFAEVPSSSFINTRVALKCVDFFDVKDNWKLRFSLPEDLS